MLSARLKDLCTHRDPLEVLASDREGMMISIMDELLDSLVLTATAASIANAIVKGQPGCNRRMIAAYLPPLPAVYIRASLEQCSNVEAQPLPSRLADYYAHLQLLREFMRNDTPGDGKRRIEPAIEAVAGAWRQLAEAGLEAMAATSAALSPEALRRTTERVETARDLLIRVARGDVPCVSPDGTVEIPVRSDRRRAERRPVNLHAYFVVGDNLQRAALINVSERGVGVEGLKGIVEGSRVGLLLRPGLVMPGSVAWVDCDRAGIELDAPLPSDCSVFNELYRRVI